MSGRRLLKIAAAAYMVQAAAAFVVGFTLPILRQPISAIRLTTPITIRSAVVMIAAHPSRAPRW